MRLSLKQIQVWREMWRRTYGPACYKDSLQQLEEMCDAATSGIIVNLLRDKTMLTKEDIVMAVALGWTTPENSGKVIDPSLANAIADEVYKAIFKAERQAQQVNATPPSV